MDFQHTLITRLLVTRHSSLSYEEIPKPDLGYRILDIRPNALVMRAGITDLDLGRTFLSR